jgi:adenosylcobinamide-GDP ribazoletransferase
VIMPDSLRLAVGTLTIIPVGPIPEIDRWMAARAMIIAPLAVLPLGIAAGLVGWSASMLGLPEIMTGLLVVGTLAVGTRALHLDGLADTADGLGSGWSPQRSLAIMKRGNIGPIGVVTLIVILAVQAVAFGTISHSVRGAVAGAAAICCSRAALSIVCRQGVPAARRSGLGVAVAGSVPVVATVLSWIAVVGTMVLATALLGRWWCGLIAATLAGAAVLILVRVCRRRLGGVTGDVMGASIEIALTLLLVCLAV